MGDGGEDIQSERRLKWEELIARRILILARKKDFKLFKRCRKAFWKL